ncbi:MAG: undecaprenyl-diphosphate phosphatase [Oscillospiraceae bacterium]|nr:undecaprenyl-diphosphate phosphatase [Oscillospiraceae bacterium]
MEIWKALLLGLIQGLTEFLPVSSSGHLALMQLLMGLEEGMLSFSVALHAGTLTAVLIVFGKDIRALVSSFIALLKPSARAEAARRPHTRMLILLAVALLPLLLGILLKGVVEELMSNALYIGGALVVTAAVIKATDYVKQPGKKTVRSATVKDALIVGVMQAAAITPGLSRSGMTISGGLLRGFDRDFAFRFSFLLSIPAILGATLLEGIDAARTGFDTALILPMLLGALVAFVSGFAALIFLRRTLLSKKFSWFAWYCLAAGALTVILSIVQSANRL